MANVTGLRHLADGGACAIDLTETRHGHIHGLTIADTALGLATALPRRSIPQSGTTPALAAIEGKR
ncbi:MAG TPA: hypothetical protein VGK35_14990 [Actinotalea sp.]